MNHYLQQQQQQQQNTATMRKRGLYGSKRMSLGSLRASKSSTTADRRPHQPINLKRRSTGCLRRPSLLSAHSIGTSDNHIKEKWRVPGRYEIPNIFGPDCFLKYEAHPTRHLRPSRPEKNVSKKPWRPVGRTPDIPQLPPLVRSANEFERMLRKALPNIQTSTLDPNNKYDGFRQIGTGVNGSVIAAVHRYKKNVFVAIKRCRIHPDAEYRTAIVRELRIMSMGHSNLIRLRDATLWRDDIWIAMDLMRCSVFAVLCKRGLPEEYTVYIALEILKALDHLHTKGYIHRDIKCENILLGWQGQVKLADFGLATRTNRNNYERLGTSKWMSPEVIRQESYNEKIDMWSLGIALIEMMDRVPPHYLICEDTALFNAVLTEPSPTFVYSYPSMYMRGLVAWLLDLQPAKRPPAKDVIREIDMHVQSRLLKSSSPNDLARFVHFVLSTPPPSPTKC